MRYRIVLYGVHKSKAYRSLRAVEIKAKRLKKMFGAKNVKIEKEKENDTNNNL